MTKLEMFAWGCEGWGSSTKELKELFADVERSRDHAPPLLVDIRFRRQGRAANFQGSKFERLLKKNYRWISALGNKNIGQKGKRPELADVSAVEELLGLALARFKSNQRVIFFCSCGLPKGCHRQLVVRRLAPKRGVSLAIDEWPGSHPQRRRLQISDEQAAKLQKSKTDQSTYLTFHKRPAAEILGMSWASVVTFVSPSHTFNAVADPPIVRGGKWKMPLPFGVDETPIRVLTKFAERSNKTNGYLF